MRIPGYRAAEIQADSTEGHPILGTEAQRASLRRCLVPEKSGKTVHRKALLRILNLMSVVPLLRNWEDRSEEEILQQERRAR